MVLKEKSVADADLRFIQGACLDIVLLNGCKRCVSGDAR